MVWFRDYKVWEGKQQNKFLWNGDILGQDKAMQLIKESHHEYSTFWESAAEMNTQKKYWRKNY